MNPLLQGHSGSTPETSRIMFSINQGTNEDHPQSDPHPEAGLFRSQTRQNSGPEVDLYSHFNSWKYHIIYGCQNILVHAIFDNHYSTTNRPWDLIVNCILCDLILTHTIADSF